MAARGRTGAPAMRASADLRRVAAQSIAARTSGARMRPSPSLSTSFRVRPSISSPEDGHARATQSFWSR
jgi:hypothetical protein